MLDTSVVTVTFIQVLCKQKETMFTHVLSSTVSTSTSRDAYLGGELVVVHVDPSFGGVQPEEAHGGMFTTIERMEERRLRHVGLLVR